MISPLFISGAEIAFIVFIVLMVFGADKLPEIARGLGKGMRQIKDATNEIKSEVVKSAKAIDDNSAINDVKTEVDKIKESIEEVSGTIKRKL